MHRVILIHYICFTKTDKHTHIMANTKSQIEIVNVNTNTVLIIKDQPVIGGGISESQLLNTIYNAGIIYEF